MKKFFGEFKEFISRGNVMDMAIGVIIATAFGKITTSLVGDVFMPLIGWLIGDIDLTQLNITLSPAVLNEAGEVTKDAGDNNETRLKVISALLTGINRAMPYGKGVGGEGV